MSEQKLDLVLETLKNIQDRLARTEADAQAALESVNALSRKKSEKTTTPISDHAGTGIGLEAALKLVHDTEDRTTSNLTRFLEIATSGQQSAQKSFLQGLSLGRELSAADLDSDGDGESDYVGLLNQLLDILKNNKKGKLNGVSSLGYAEPRLQAGGNGSTHEGENP